MLSKFKCNPELDKKVPDLDELSPEEFENVVERAIRDAKAEYKANPPKLPYGAYYDSEFEDNLTPRQKRVAKIGKEFDRAVKQLERLKDTNPEAYQKRFDQEVDIMNRNMDKLYED